MKEVQLTRGKVALVDDEDYPLVSAYRWFYHAKNREEYAVANTPMINGKRKTILMHRLIMGFPNGLQIDHRNHNGLDNRRANLRLATHSQNQANALCHSSLTGVKGVSRRPNGRFQAQIRINGKTTYLGCFDSIEEASNAYQQVAKTIHGEFAVTD